MEGFRRSKHNLGKVKGEKEGEKNRNRVKTTEGVDVGEGIRK